MSKAQSNDLSCVMTVWQGYAMTVSAACVCQRRRAKLLAISPKHKEWLEGCPESSRTSLKALISPCQCRYMLPALSLIPSEAEECVRVEYAGILAQLAATAHRFLMRLQGPPAQQARSPVRAHWLTAHPCIITLLDALQALHAGHSTLCSLG